MFVFNENNRDIQFVTIYRCSIPVVSFIFYMIGIFMTEQDEIYCCQIFKKSRSVQKNRTRIGKKSSRLCLVNSQLLPYIKDESTFLLFSYRDKPSLGCWQQPSLGYWQKPSLGCWALSGLLAEAISGLLAEALSGLWLKPSLGCWQKPSLGCWQKPSPGCG